ncbi:hypothetical protein UA08_08579 [Talaromyces atroroseus]|uniref:Cell pattern formation-associated protein stuA n=1 Tax=Talaromyces atroroseus TaxID=1441469 RepID=A0A1Q5Q7H6_TALAT|nr:hypothetical protein UA08_08579 [Talaromyces atroroseus]OKL56168.1 hypothetical protein UA08_08579 [Talaromyces atroroseus]
MRSLPKQNNPLILPDASPSYQELLALRRLGKTNLAVKPTQVGTSNATKPENLGPFEYAHLRAPLPKDLSGSEIFPSQTPKQDTYFLMRRSKDGYISATGMFKIAFPWAKADEEKSEREYVKSRTETSVDETAGNLWISPILALELAKEYQMLDWVRALLDSTDIAQNPISSKKPITPPPKFDMPPLENLTELPPTRTRSRRSDSPAKTSPKKTMSPRKSRAPRSVKESSAAATTAASDSLQAALNGAAEKEEPSDVAESNDVDVTEPTEAKPKKSRSKKQVLAPTSDEKDTADEKVTVSVESTTEVKDEVETTQTNVSVEMPVSLPDLPPAEDTEQMLAQAKQMVEAATKLQDEDATAEPSSSSKATKKRKSDEVEEDEEEKSATPAQPTKKARVLEDKLRKERVRNRALVGVTASLALA